MDRPDIKPTDANEADDATLAVIPDDDWVHELIAMTRPGVEIQFPSRTLAGRVTPFEYDDFS